MARHTLAKREIEKYASVNVVFTTREMQSHLLDKKRSYHLTMHELGNILARLPSVDKLDSVRKNNKIITSWVYEGVD